MEFSSLIILIAGIVIGSLIVYFISRQRVRSEQQVTSGMKDTFAALASEALDKSMDQFLKLAKETLKNQIEKGELNLEEKKKLIDVSLKNMSEVLEDLKSKSTTLSTQISEGQKETFKLRTTTEDLRRVLSSSQARGQWGEKMVEDILRIVGLVEGVNYSRQKKIESGERPDYTFNLPKEKKVNMDVKFPLTHYEKYIATEDEEIMEREKKQFLSDVKEHIKTVAGRGYINPEEGTVDYVLLFIPNESIYAFIHQSNWELLDFALEKHIILCSPITLYAVLSLIHQAVSNFAVEMKTGEIIALLRNFEKQWQMFVSAMEKMGKRIEDAKKEFENLTTTRKRQLEKPLNKIREIGFFAESETPLISNKSEDTE